MYHFQVYCDDHWTFFLHAYASEGFSVGEHDIPYTGISKLRHSIGNLHRLEIEKILKSATEIK